VCLEEVYSEYLSTQSLGAGHGEYAPCRMAVYSGGGKFAESQTHVKQPNLEDTEVIVLPIKHCEPASQSPTLYRAVRSSTPQDQYCILAHLNLLEL